MFNFLGSYYGSMLILLPAFILSIIAQFLVKSTFAKYSKVKNSRGLNGAETAKLILRSNGISDVQVEAISGSLTDHYDPSSKTLRLSEAVYNKNSVAALGVAAHEVGHAIQHKKSYGPLVLRSTLVPIANIGSQIGPMLVFVGIFISSLSFLINAGIILFSAAVGFYLITLPVEFDASARALRCLEEGNILTYEELKGAKRVLQAAALTYVASALSAVASLIRLILLSRRKND